MFWAKAISSEVHQKADDIWNEILQKYPIGKYSTKLRDKLHKERVPLEYLKAIIDYHDSKPLKQECKKIYLKRRTKLGSILYASNIIRS